MDSEDDMDYQRPDDPNKVYKYTKEELDELIKETWIADCKVDACVDKFFSQVTKLNPEYWATRRWRWDFSDFNDKKFIKLKDFESLKKELCSDLETFVPGCFDKFEPSATVDDKFKSLEKRVKEAYGRCRADEEPPKKGEFRDVLVRMLADKHLQKLTEPSSSSSGDTDKGPTSLHQSSLNQVLEQLRCAVEGEEATTTYACGGSIAVGSPEAKYATTEKHSQSDFEDQEVERRNKARKRDENRSGLDLPAEIKTPDNIDTSAPVVGTNALESLVHDCTPATFGRGDKDVLDPEYRSAGKLDTDHFCTTFHPADFGILETIEQILLPNVDLSSSDTARFRRVRAELYKLNVYSGPSGIFRKHVDTPRSQYQFGSLVVCLPSPHEGGTLLVRHNGQTVEFDWSSLSSSRLQWAAFYSDCEHEITRVSDGHRITLTYNLLIAEPIGASLIPNPVVEPRSFPLYAQIKDMLGQPGVFKDGGVLGFFCSHSYAHASDTAAIDLPRKLKGSDMVIFAILRSLGLLVEVLPVLENHGEYFPPNPLGVEPNVKTGMGRCYLDPERDYDNDADRLEEFREKGYITKYIRHRGAVRKVRGKFNLKYVDFGSYDTDCEDIETRWKTLLMGRSPFGRTMTKGSTVGKKLHPRVSSDLGGEDEPSDEVVKSIWPNYFLPGITWITSPKDEVEALSHMCYGNEASMGTRYSCAAIIAIVPPWNQRAEPSV